MDDDTKLHALDLMEMEIAMTDREHRCMYEVEDVPGNTRYCGRGKGHPGAHAAGVIRAGTFCMWTKIADCEGDTITPPAGSKCPMCDVALTAENTGEQYLGLDEDGTFNTRHACHSCIENADDDD